MWVTTFGSGITPTGFLGRRIRRIVPLYWVFTAFAVFLAVVAPQLGKRTGALDAVASFLFLPAVNSATHVAEPVIAPGWTLNHEMLFYLIFAAALLLPTPKARFAGVVGANAALAIIGWLTHGPLVVSFFTNPIILEFVFGVVVGSLYTSGYCLSRRNSAVIAVLGVGTMIGCASAWGQNVNLRILLWGIPAACVLMALVLTENYRPVRERRRWLFVGDASYSIYLVHGIVLSAVFAAVRHAGVPYIVMIPVGTPAAIIVAFFVYRYIERPMTRRLSRWARRSTAPAGGLIAPEVAGAAVES
jgi:peptidoglycan/LPS O-acetylase OafA/YrhL